MFVIDFSPHLAKKKYPVRNLRISPDAGTLAATFGTEWNAAHVAWWNLSAGKLRAVHPVFPLDFSGNPAEPAFLADLSRCAIHDYDTSAFGDFIKVLELGRKVSSNQNFSISFDDELSAPELLALAFSPDGQWLLSVHSGGRTSAPAICRHPICGTESAPVQGKRRSKPREVQFSGDADDWVVALAVSPDGKRIACSRVSREVQVLDFKTLTKKGTLQLIKPKTDSWELGRHKVVFSSDNKLLAVLSKDRVEVFQLKLLQRVGQLKPTNFTDMAFTPDGKRFLTGGLDKVVRVWDTATWEEVARYDWKIGAIHSVAVSPDGAIAAAGGDKSRVVVWDLDG